MRFSSTAPSCLVALAACALSAPFANADTVLYDANSPLSNSGAFTYGDFGPITGDPNATGNRVYDDGSNFTIFALNDADNDAGIFGGLARDVAPQDFDASDFTLEIEYRPVDGTNAANEFRLLLIDSDAGGREVQQYFVVNDEASDLSDGFLLASFDASAPDSTNEPKDGIVNFGLEQWQIQSVFGGSEPLAIEVRRIELVEVPEPGTLGLLGLGGVLLAARRRRA